MNLAQEAERLLGEILLVFDVAAVPGPGNLVSHDCEECAAVQEVFAGRRWTELSSADLYKEPAALALLTDEAHAYHLAAFLAHSIKNRLPDLAEDVLSDLESSMGGRPERVAVLSDPQRRCIGSWCVFVAKHAAALGVDPELAGRVARQWARGSADARRCSARSGQGPLHGDPEPGGPSG